MKWLGYKSSSPVDPTPGALETAQNTRLTVVGEARSRRGMARSSLSKIAGPVKAISDFAFAPGSPYAVVLGNGTVDGNTGISSQWGDSHLTALTGVSSPGSGTSFTITIYRNGCSFADGAFIFADEPSFPTDTSASVIVDFLALDPSADSATMTWTAPYSASWRFRAYGRHLDQLGPGGNLAQVSTTLATWNPSDKGPNATLTNGNLTFRGTNSSGVRATAHHSTGKWYYEFKVEAFGAIDAMALGVGTASASLTTELGFTSAGWSFELYATNNRKFHGSSTGTTYGQVSAVNDIVSVLLDLTSGELTYWQNGVSQGVAFTGISGDIYPMISGDANPVSVGGTVNFGATAFVYTPPTGYMPWYV